ncbi:replication initiator [Micromonospora antibiotica]|uniref:Replication initiation protein n=1 Tax=Micromonospora antibiotica TaxID=2807623 RepID=A0ABS3VAL3_9ACTN|nr:replication initiator [Micromonospora antibiotica]MBO4162629.1 replication initiation protein [Micromonospora antibiotica]
MRSPAYKEWRAGVESVKGCLQPVRLVGKWEVRHLGTGDLIASRQGRVWASCGTRRAAICPTCADRYAADAWHLIHAGMSGGKGVPDTVARSTRLFVTLTAPSFGAVHNRPGKRPCSCGRWHPEGHPLLGSPLDPGTYDYTGAVLWQAHSGQLWHRFTIALRRAVAAAGGLTVRASGAHLRISYAKVAEYQRRGLVHFHAVIRADGPSGPDSTPPAWLTPDVLTDAVRTAASSVELDTARPDGTPLALQWGKQVDVKDITATDIDVTNDNDDGDQVVNDTRLAGYIAKYATKGTGATETGDRRIRSQAHIGLLRVSDHHRAMIQTAWDLGGLDQYTDLKLRHWAHMLGFRGHFLTKSRIYSTTFKNLRAERQAHQLRTALTDAGLPEDTDVLVANDWQILGIGYDTPEQLELATAIGDRIRTARQQARKDDGDGSR